MSQLICFKDYQLFIECFPTVWGNRGSICCRCFALRHNHKNLLLSHELIILKQLLVRQWMCSKQAEVCRTGKPVRRSYNKTHINNLEKLHAGAGRIVYGLPWDTANLMGRFGNNEQRTRKIGLTPWKNSNTVLQNLILIIWISNLF